MEACQGRFARAAFAGDVVEGCRGGGLHVGIKEALEDVNIRIGGYVGYDVDCAGVRERRSLPRVDRVEGEERVGFIYADEASAVHAVDDKPKVRLAGIRTHGIDEVLCPEHLGAPARIVRIEDAEHDVVFRQEEGVQVRGADRPARQGCEDGRLARRGAHAEDAVNGLSAHLEVVVVPVAGDGVGARVRGSEGAFEVRVQGRLANGGEWCETCGVEALEGGVVGLEPESADFWSRGVVI